MILTRLLFFILIISSTLQSAFTQESMRVMFYNTENLFDATDDTLKNDEEFLPNSIRRWNYFKYKHKLIQIGKVITALGQWDSPALVGLCEVENDSVVYSLIKFTPFREHGYRYVVTNSRDERGIDIALLYQRDKFRLINMASFPVYLPAKKFRPTRDILYVSGEIINGDTLDIFVCHFPSRSAGELESEPARLIAASTLKQKTDSICKIRKSPLLLIMGDLNDYPKNKSIKIVLNALIPDDEPLPDKLYNLMAAYNNNSNAGSHKFKGEWGFLDQIIVNGNLLNSKSSVQIIDRKANAFSPPFLLKKEDKELGDRTFRTYWGMKYEGGFSDHLPVYTDISIKTN